MKMNKNYEPDKDKNIMPIKLVELVDSDNIEYNILDFHIVSTFDSYLLMRDQCGIISTTIALASPPPIQIAAIPLLKLLCFNA